MPVRAEHRRAALSLAPIPVRVGPCMSALLKPGDEALLDPCAWEDLKAGDLVALETQEGPVLHRYLGARLTKGDLSPRFDAKGGTLLGRIAGIRRDGRLVRRPRGIPLAELPAVAASLARGLAALARRRIGCGP